MNFVPNIKKTIKTFFSVVIPILLVLGVIFLMYKLFTMPNDDEEEERKEPVKVEGYSADSPIAHDHFKRLKWLEEKVVQDATKELSLLQNVKQVKVRPADFSALEADDYFSDYDLLSKEDVQWVKKKVKDIKKPNGINGEPIEVALHVKENWANNAKQKSELLEILSALQKKKITTANVVYNSSMNLKKIPSKWFTFTNDKDDMGDGLASLNEFHAVKDLDTLDTIYSGLYYGIEQEDDYGETETVDSKELVRFNGDKVK